MDDMTLDDRREAELLEKLKQRFAEADATPARGQSEAAQRPAKRSRTADDEKVAPAQRNRRQWVVVSYDIVDDKRRNKVMKTLEGFGHRVQYSVFECELRPADLEKLKARLASLILPEQDDVRFYLLCENCQGKATMLGRAQMYHAQPYAMV
jgi:CRISPR-associated protein Cas2